MPAKKKTTEPSRNLMAAAITHSLEGMRSGRGGPFGAIVARDGEIVGRGSNQVLTALDPTAHAEVVAIRDACRNLGSFQLDGCDLYTSCEPCPMCLGAAYWARVDRIIYANSRSDAAAIGFGDDFIYREFARPRGKRKLPMARLMGKEAFAVFLEWRDKEGKIPYGPDLPVSGKAARVPARAGRARPAKANKAAKGPVKRRSAGLA